MHPEATDHETFLQGRIEAHAKGEALAQFFAFGHLPNNLREVSAKFAELAVEVLEQVPRNAERTVALRKLLESKDCAVRAVLFKAPVPQ